MGAVYKRELKAYTRNVYAFLFAAVFLVAMGATMFFFNLNYRLAKLSYAWGGGYIELALVLITPILCMRSMAYDRRQGVDIFYRSLPISTTSVVLGKYFALLTVFAAPLAVTCLYPLLLSSFGKVNYAWSYSILLMLLLLGAALIALCMFLSTLTRNPWISAAMGFSVCLALFFFPNLLEIMPDNSIISFILLAFFFALLSVIGFLLTKSVLVIVITAGATLLPLSILYLIDTINEGSVFDGLFSFSLLQINPFYQYEYVAHDGFMDLFAVLMLLSFAVFFVCMTALVSKARADQ